MSNSDPSGPSGLTGSAQSQQSGAGRRSSFWSDAPGLRRLTVAAAALTTCALALPALLPLDKPTVPGPAPAIVGPAAPAATVPTTAQPPAPVATAPTTAQPPAPVATAPTTAQPPAPVAMARTAPLPAPVAAAPTTVPPHSPAATPAAKHEHDELITVSADTPASAPAIPRLASAAPAPLPQPAGGAVAQPADDTQTCHIRAPGMPQHFGLGVVVGFENHDISLARIQLTQNQMGGKIDPSYIDLQRVNLRMPNGRIITFIQPKNLPVHVGDRVTVQDAYRNVNLPCTYIPQQITSDLGPAENPSVPGAGAPAAPPTDGGDQIPPNRQ